jgi:hypothetical protein
MISKVFIRKNHMIIRDKIQFSTDWLASDPVFYNEKTGKVSRNINEVIDFRNLQFHPEGLKNYLDTGYSILEQTPVQHVKFLRHSSSLKIHEGHVQVEYGEDQAEKLIGRETSPDEVIELLRSSINAWENSIEGEIMIPTSGGYDSRMLNDLVQDKHRIRSFTYGLSSDQSRSFEVVYASKIAELLKIKWEQIDLGEFHNYFDDWDKLFGPSTHAHGMYQIEFYNRVLKKLNKGSGLLSGIIGDAWAGSVKIPALKHASDVHTLGYAHNIKADSDHYLLKSDPQLVNAYYDSNKHKLQDPRFRVVESMRFKIVLLCYLFRVPASLGFKPWSPFLDRTIALSMLNLPDDQRMQRAWQVNYFRKRGLYIEVMNLPASKKNNLNRQGMSKVPVRPLDVKLLSEIMRPQYVEWVNKNVQAVGWFRDFADSLQYYPKIGGLLRRMGQKDVKLTAYLAYLTLRPLEVLIKKRNNS